MSSPLRQSASDAAQTRVLNDEDPMLQAALEQLAVTYSIRTTLLWTLVVVPLALVVIGVVLAFILHTPVDDQGIAR
jgi:ABC-type sugar transport system permease subunit